MIIKELMDYLLKNNDSRGIPDIPYSDWIDIIEKYEKNDIRQTIARYITDNNIPFPFKELDEHDLKGLFYGFSRKSMLEMYKNFDDVSERYEYVNSYSDKPLGVIDKSHYYNPVSDIFQQKNRMRCGSSSMHSPLEIWENEELLSKMNWHFWRLNVLDNKDINAQTFREGFRLGTYTATQFKPSVAKALYQKHDAKNILDTSCGWGDRLAGFYASPKSENYVGCDPNPNVFETYKEQCVFYENVLGCSNPEIIERQNYFRCVGNKTVEIWRKASEDVDWSLYDNFFDFYFTSPPYFETEKYNQGGDMQEDQSWFRYSSFEKWKKDFLFEVTENIWGTIKENGFMMINIIEPKSNNIRYNLCDDMVDYFEKFDQCNYLGKIGMRMMARPHTDKEELRGVFIEPIWVFRRGCNEYEYNNVASLEDFFS